VPPKKQPDDKTTLSTAEYFGRHFTKLKIAVKSLGFVLLKT